MAIELSKSTRSEKADTKTTLQVYMYLGALDCFTNGVSKREREKVADDFMREHPLRVDNKADALKTVESLEKQYAAIAKETPLKTKVQAEFGMKAPEKAFKAACVLGASAVLAGVAAGLGYEPATVAAMSAGAAVLFSGVAKVAAQGTEEKPDKVAKEEWDVQKYGDVKRALFALKKMKKALAPESTYKKEVQALYASGLGNPGGMITALNLKQGGR